MKKLYIINDLHFGVRNSNPIFLKELSRIFDQLVEVLQPQDEIAILGDVFDNRNTISIKAMNTSKECFDKLRHWKVTIIPGNHDIHYVNRLKPNSLDPLLENFDNIEILYEPTAIKFGVSHILYVPWVCPDYDRPWSDIIKKSNANICFGHFDIQGFYFNRTTKNKHGFEPKVFSNFDNVYSGHYHISSSDKNITYLGTQYQMTWEDNGERKFIHILDEQGVMTKIESGREIFRRVKFDEYKEILNDVSLCYIRLVADSKISQKEIKEATEELLKAGAFEVKVMQEFSNEIDVSSDEVETILGANKTIKEVVSEMTKKVELDESFDESKIHILVDDIVAEAYEMMSEVQ